MNDDSTESCVLIFPHSTITESALERAYALFGPLTICLPWYMDAPLPTSGEEKGEHLRFLRPPEHLKPRDDFKTLLSEYRLWIRQNRDKGSADFDKFSQDPEISENTRWEIRKMIRRMGTPSSSSAAERSLGWHLVLHLAAEIEKNRWEASEIVHHLKQMGSPLEEAVGEKDQMRSLLGDLPEPDAEPWKPHQVRQVLDAWIGLFETNLLKFNFTLTFDKQILTTIEDLFQAVLPEGGKLRARTELNLGIPDTSFPSTGILRRDEQHLSNEIKEALCTLVQALDEAEIQEEALSRVTGELEKRFPSNPALGKLRVILQKCPDLSGVRHPQEEAFLKALSGRKILLVEKGSPYE